MNEQQIKELLRKLIAHQVNKKNVLLILTCANDYEKEVKELLTQYQSKCHYYLIFSDSFNAYMNPGDWKNIGNEISSLSSFHQLIDQMDLVMIPFLTRNSLAKLALGIADTFSLTAMQHCLLAGKKIIAVENSWAVTNELGKIKGLNNNASYTSMLNRYKEQLTAFGVISVPFSEVKQQIEEQLFQQLDDARTKDSLIQVQKFPINQSILTLKDVIDNPNIHRCPESKMTDLAKEYLTEKARKTCGNKSRENP